MELKKVSMRLQNFVGDNLSFWRVWLVSGQLPNLSWAIEFHRIKITKGGDI
jgi:hypothetical protein